MLVSSSIVAEERSVKNVLIVYGSFAGSTREIAEKMKDTLDGMKCNVELMPAANRNVDLSKYDLVVIGSAIHIGKPHPDVMKFIEKNHVALEQKKVAVFVVCIAILSEKLANRTKAEHYPDKVAVGFTPVSTTVFAGVVKDSGWFANWMIEQKPGDYRDWKKIDDWTKSLPGLM
jgi:menaquinone-dependent protoporphyrinogen oxidase